MKFESSGRSTSRFIISSSEVSAVEAVWYWTSRPATCAIGAIAREASMVQAIRPPMVSMRSPISQTPRITITRLMVCCTKAEPLVALEESRRNWAPTRASKAAPCSHLRWIGASAPMALTVSKPTSPSIRVALRCALAR